MFLCLFLSERLRSLTEADGPRIRDISWQRTVCTILHGYGQLAVVCFFWPLSDISTTDGKCRIGLPNPATIPLLIFTIICNLAIAGRFYWKTRKYQNGWVSLSLTLRYTHLCNLEGFFLSGEDHQKVVELKEREKKDRHCLLARISRQTGLGSLLILLSTVSNLCVLLALRGREFGWVCFMGCTLDMCWNVMVVNYLISDPVASERGTFEEASPSSDHNTRSNPLGDGHSPAFWRQSLGNAHEMGPMGQHTRSRRDETQ